MKLSQRSFVSLWILLITIGWLLNSNMSFGYDVTDIQIQISPNVLNIRSKGELVTIHTYLPFSIVKAKSVCLNGVAISSWKSDDEGYFVANFDINKIISEAGLIVGNNRMILTGVTIKRVQFTGEQILKVEGN